MPSKDSAPAPHHHGHRQRLRQRFLDGGADKVLTFLPLNALITETGREQPKK